MGECHAPGTMTNVGRVTAVWDSVIGALAVCVSVRILEEISSRVRIASWYPPAP